MKITKPVLKFSLGAILTLGSSASHATLLGLELYLPIIDFSSSGTIDYNASTGIVSVSGSPSTLFSADPFIFTDIHETAQDQTKNVDIRFQVDNGGNFVSGIANSPDLVITGSVDIDGDSTIDYDGILLSADVSHFGFLNGVANGDDSFDLKLNSIDGALAYLYNGFNLAVSITGEVSSAYSNPFKGSFGGDWQGLAKGTIGLSPNSQPEVASVPVPPAFWLWAGALCAAFLPPTLRRSKR